MDDVSRRTPVRLCLALLLLLVVAASAAVAGAGGRPGGTDRAAAVPVSVDQDAGDDLAVTTFDGPMVRRRAALAIVPAPGADRAAIARELRAAARAARVGPLADATFAVFGEDLLRLLVPELTLVFGEGVTVRAADAFLRDHQPRTVAFALVQPVLVHDVTFAVVPAPGVAPAAVRDAADREGILADSLNRYATTVQRAGVTVRYFGAVLGDGQIGAVRAALGRAARVDAARVQVSANQPGPGVNLRDGIPDLETGAGGHGHG